MNFETNETKVHTQFTEPELVEWITFIKNGIEKTYKDLKNTYVQIIIDRVYAYSGKTSENIYPVMSFQNYQFQLISNEVVINSAIMENAYVSFKLKKEFKKEYTISNKFLPITYDAGNLIIDNINLSNLRKVNLNNLSNFTYDIKLNNSNHIYEMILTPIPVNFRAISIDKTEEVIVNEPNVIHIIRCGKRYFKGIAKCLTEDKFDLNKGLEIAKLKAEIKQKEFRLKELVK